MSLQSQLASLISSIGADVKDLDARLDALVSITTEASNAAPTPTGNFRQNEHSITALAVTATIAAPSGTPANGNSLLIRIKDNGTAQTINWNAIFRAVGVVLPITTVIGKTLYVGAKYNSADSKWDALAVAQEA